MKGLTINRYFIFRTLGFLLIVEALFMAFTSILSFWWNEESGISFLISAIITFLSGVILGQLKGRNQNNILGKRESFIVVTVSWVLIALFGSFPYWISGDVPNFTNSFFESMSGFTSTGSTVLEGVESMSKAVLFWRSLSQWIGGIGIIVIALILMPIVGTNLSKLYETETSGMVKERLRPRMGQIAKRLIITYLILTAILILLLYLGPMDLFDSICHAFATVSTGGFSTKSESILHWNSAYIDYVTIIFMFIGGVNFTLIYYAMRGLFPKILKNEEFFWYVAITLIFTLIITIGVLSNGIYSSLSEGFRVVLFQVVSSMTSTSFTIANIMSWGTYYLTLFCFLMLFCGCAGSTTGGMKITRLIVVLKNIINEFKLLIHPTAVLPVRINDTVVSPSIISKILSFVLLYFLILIVSFIVLSFAGMNLEEAFVISVTSLGNAGAGYGRYGEGNTFFYATDFEKWYICFLMLLGRLEIFTVLALMIPAFWRK